MIKIHENHEDHEVPPQPRVYMFLFWPVVHVQLRHQYTYTYRQGKFKSKTIIFLAAVCDVFISWKGTNVFQEDSAAITRGILNKYILKVVLKSCVF